MYTIAIIINTTEIVIVCNYFLKLPIVIGKQRILLFASVKLLLL